MNEVPQLRTARLLLRGFEERDFNAYAAMMADLEVTRFLGAGYPLTRDDAWHQFNMFVDHWVRCGFGVWAVEERVTAAFVGRVGCFEPEGWPGFEVSYTLARPYWGRGFAREAAAAALAYAREVLGRERIISIIRPANLASIRVAAALGATPDGSVEFFGSPATIYTYAPGPDAGSRAQ